MNKFWIFKRFRKSLYKQTLAKEASRGIKDNSQGFKDGSQGGPRAFDWSVTSVTEELLLPFWILQSSEDPAAVKTVALLQLCTSSPSTRFRLLFSDWGLLNRICTVALGIWQQNVTMKCVIITISSESTISQKIFCHTIPIYTILFLTEEDLEVSRVLKRAQKSADLYSPALSSHEYKPKTLLH